MKIKSLHLIGVIALAVVPLHSQSSPVYWSATKPNCTSLGQTTPVTITNASGATIGYSCSVTGTFVWLAAGGMWGTTIRVSAPASADVDVHYWFFDRNGNNQDIDNTLDNDPSSIASGSDVEVPLFSNQALEVELLGASSDAPNYANTAEGSVYAEFLCPDAATCANVLPQLLYSALPSQPWSLSVPIAWDNALSSQWSAVAIDDGVTNVIGLVIYNEDTSASRFRVDVYDSNGNLAGSGLTPTIPPLQVGGTGEGGTYAVLLDDLVSTIPSGPFKLLVDGGSLLSAVEVLQINGTSATTLQVAYDSAPGAASAVAKAPRTSVRRLHMESTPRLVARRTRK